MIENARITISQGNGMIFYDISPVLEKKEKFGLTFFLGKNNYIFEYRSGLTIAVGKDPEEAWKKAFEILDKYGKEKIKERLEEHFKKHTIANTSRFNENDPYTESADAYYLSLEEGKMKNEI